MAYRDDLEAALAHAEAAERDLAAAREENQHDHQRIAELEKQLAAAQHKLGETRKREPKPEPKPKPQPKPAKAATDGEKKPSLAPTVIALFLAVLVIAGITWAILYGSCTTSDGIASVDVSASLPAATEKARKYFPDPVLKSIRADYVNPQGVSDLASYHGYVTYGFASPSRMEQPAPAPVGPIGAPQPEPTYANCAVDVRYRADSMRYYETPGRGIDSCGEPLSRPPTCKVTDVWAEAIRRGAPKNALAQLRLEMGSYGSYGKGARVPLWRFTISDQSKTLFEMELPDGCPIAAPN